MASRPRPSLLDLFDPLLADAVRVPIPESPPNSPRTPSKSPDCGPENKENVAPKELTMSVFFDRISSMPNSKAQKFSKSTGSGQLVDFTDETTESVAIHNITPASSRIPLAEISVDDFGTPVTPRLLYGSAKKTYASPSHSRVTHTSASRKAQLASHLFPVISVSDSSQHKYPTSQFSKSPPSSPMLPKELQLRREPRLNSPRNALMPPPISGAKSNRLQPRRSSLDISMTTSSLSSSFFHIPDASFDLVNGEISFLSKTSLEEEDMNQELLLEEHETPMLRLPPQKMIIDESPLDSLAISQGWDTASTVPNDDNDDNNEQTSVFEEIPIDNKLVPATESDDHPTATYSNRSSSLYTAPSPDRQRTLSTISDSSTTTVRNIFVQEHNATRISHVSPVNADEQDTPLTSRRISSVPAPMKKLRAFTSDRQRAAMASTTQATVRVLPGAPARLSKASKAIDTSGGSGVLMGGARRNPKVGAILETNSTVRKKPFSANSTATNIGAAPRTIRPPSSSMFPKANPTSHNQHAKNPEATASKLPGPGARDSSLPKLSLASRLPAPSQKVPKGRDAYARPRSRIGVANGNRLPKV